MPLFGLPPALDLEFHQDNDRLDAAGQHIMPLSPGTTHPLLFEIVMILKYVGKHTQPFFLIVQSQIGKLCPGNHTLP